MVDHRGREMEDVLDNQLNLAEPILSAETDFWDLLKIGYIRLKETSMMFV